MALGLAAASLAAAPALASRKLPLVMIDPGHGGHDPGAIAPDGIYDKDITLASGLALRHALLATGRYRVKMTRTTDVFVTLDGRVAATVSAGAGLFLALHCDHLPRPDMRGASVFTLSNKASDGLAAGIANDENAASAGGHSTSPQLANILASLETRATRMGSATLAEDIQNSFSGIVPLLPDPHRSANFAVLRDPSTPSTLLEMGCLTNPLDEALLKSPTHRRLMATRLTSAIDAYFADHAGQRVAG
jgi:N-acetylmuramoyl-L-alanine amidase